MSKAKETDQPFEQKMLQSMQASLSDFIRKGDWLKFNYDQKLPIDSAWLRTMHAKIDMDRVMELVKEEVEVKIANGILNSMAQEIANDIKSVMSNKELREDIRAMIRAKIREVEGAVKQ